MQNAFLAHMCAVADETLTRPTAIPLPPATIQAALNAQALNGDTSAASALRALNVGRDIMMPDTFLSLGTTMLNAMMASLTTFLNEQETLQHSARLMILEHAGQVFQDAMCTGLFLANAALQTAGAA